MNPSEYAKMVKIADERQAAWYPPAIASQPTIFNRPIYTLQALIVFAGVVGTLAYEALKWVFNWLS